MNGFAAVTSSATIGSCANVLRYRRPRRRRPALARPARLNHGNRRAGTGQHSGLALDCGSPTADTTVELLHGRPIVALALLVRHDDRRVVTTAGLAASIFAQRATASVINKIGTGTVTLARVTADHVHLLSLIQAVANSLIPDRTSTARRSEPTGRSSGTLVANGAVLPVNNSAD